MIKHAPKPARAASRPTRGFGMVETMLGIAVATVVLAGMATVLADGQRELRAKNVAEQHTAFMTAAGNFFLANKPAMLKAMEDGTGANDYCVVGANPATGVGGTTANSTALHTCALDVDWLKWKQAIPSNFRASNVHNQRLVAIFKRVYDGATATDAAEMLAVGADVGGAANSVQSLRELQAGAELMGGSGGYVPDKDRVVCTYDTGSSTYQACGTQGGWQVDLKQFVSTL